MANLVTLSRFPLMLLYVVMLYSQKPIVLYWSVPFVIVIFLLDGLDGKIARARQETSLLGSTLDIATDRAFELVLWTVFAHIGLIPVALPIIAIIRGTTVDAVRAVGMSDGKAAFDQVRHPVSRFIVASRFMRDAYGLVKGASFAFFTFTQGLLVAASPHAEMAVFISQVLAWITIGITVIRGLPVLIEAYSLLQNPPQAKSMDV